MVDKTHDMVVNYKRMPKPLQEKLGVSTQIELVKGSPLRVNEIHHGDARQLIPSIEPNSVALSVWSPPYFVGKRYESYLKDFNDWQNLVESVIALHYPVIAPGGFLVVNIADILCFKDAKMPRVSAEAISRKRSKIARQDVLEAMAQNPTMNRYQLAKLLGCSEQTIDRRLNGNNIRGGKYEVQTRVRIVGGLIENWALQAGFYTYDRRIWAKDAAWENSRWASLSYRSVDEFEYLYFFWKPGVTKFDRSRLTPQEWRDWGSRGIWTIPSVRANDNHEAKFPLELPSRVIKLLTDPGDVVLDCFIGSGTTAVAALKQERSFIGIDIEKKSVALSNRQIKQATPTSSSTS